MDIIFPSMSDVLSPNVFVNRFPDGEIYIKVNGDLSDDKFTVFHRLYPQINERILQLILLIKHISEYGDIDRLVIPYLPYARQDKVWEEGELRNSRYFVELLGDLGVKEILTFDCHFMKKVGVEKIGRVLLNNYSLGDLIREYASANIFKGLEFSLVSPDYGGSYLVGNEGIIFSKHRGMYVSDEGGIHRSVESVVYEGDSVPENILIIDDLISGGGTMMKSIALLRKLGAKKIVCSAVHGQFLHGSLEKLESSCDSVFTSNTILNRVSHVNFMDLLNNLNK